MHNMLCTWLGFRYSEHMAMQCLPHSFKAISFSIVRSYRNRFYELPYALCCSPFCDLPCIFFQTKTSGLLFYTKARQNLWRQAFAMSSVAITAFGAILAKRLTTYGRGTPIVSWNVQVHTSYASCSCCLRSVRSCLALAVFVCTLAFADELLTPTIASKTQACTFNIACGIFTLFTTFEEPAAERRRLRRSSRTLPTDVSSTRRSSLLAAGTTAAQQLLQQLSPNKGRQTLTRKSSDHLRQEKSPVQRDRALVGAPGDEGLFLVELPGVEDRHMRRGTVSWAGTKYLGDTSRNISRSTNVAKVLPTQGSNDSLA